NECRELLRQLEMGEAKDAEASALKAGRPGRGRARRRSDGRDARSHRFRRSGVGELVLASPQLRRAHHAWLSWGDAALTKSAVAGLSTTVGPRQLRSLVPLLGAEARVSGDSAPRILSSRWLPPLSTASPSASSWTRARSRSASSPPRSQRPA